MTTDLSELHPNKDFQSEKSTKVAPVWLLSGVGVLVATGIAAFGPRLGSDLDAAASPALQGAALASEPTPPESEQVAANIFAAETEQDGEAEDDGHDLGVQANGQATVVVSDEPLAGIAGTADAMQTAPAGPEKLQEGSQVEAAEQATLGAYYVQLASYHTKERADQHAAELASRGLSAQSVAYGGPSAGWWHAVRMGPYEKRADAEKQRFGLQAHERRSAYVLPRSNGKFHVQVASFAEREEAEQVAKKFTAEGHATKVTRVKMSGSYWHCVRIGPFDTREEALAYQPLVADVPGSESTVIPFGPPLSE